MSSRPRKKQRDASPIYASYYYDSGEASAAATSVADPVVASPPAPAPPVDANKSTFSIVLKTPDGDLQVNLLLCAYSRRVYFGDFVRFHSMSSVQYFACTV